MIIHFQQLGMSFVPFNVLLNGFQRVHLTLVDISFEGVLKDGQLLIWRRNIILVSLDILSQQVILGLKDILRHR